MPEPLTLTTLLIAGANLAGHDIKEAIQIVQEIDAGGRDHLVELKWRVLGDMGTSS